MRSSVNELEAFIDSLAQATERDLYTQYGNDFYEWHVSNQDNVSLHGSNLRRIRLNLKLGYKNHINRALMDVILKDSHGIITKKTYVLDPAQYQQLLDYFKKNNVHLQQWNMIKHSGQAKLDWSRLHELYIEPVKQDYMQIHRAIVDTLKSTLLPRLRTDTQFTAVNLVDAGSGQAPTLLNTCYKEALTTGKPVMALGFDYEQSNVDVCNKSAHPADVHFIREDSNHLESIIKGNPHLIHGQNTFNVVISSGTMTRRTLNDAYEAARILKACWRAPVHLLIAGGERELLFNRRILKRIGFKIEYQNVLDNHPVICMQRMSEQELLQDTNKRLAIKPNYLDLSLNPCAHDILDQITTAQCDKIKTIDLSFSDFNNNRLAASLLRFKNLKEIIFHYSDINDLIKFIDIIPPGIELRACYANDEKNLFASEKYKRRALLASQHADPNDEIINTFMNLMLKNLLNAPPEQKRLWLQCIDLYKSTLEKHSVLLTAQDNPKTILFLLSMLSAKNNPDLTKFIDMELKRLGPLSNDDLSCIAATLIKLNAADRLHTLLNQNGIRVADFVANNGHLLSTVVDYDAFDVLMLFHKEGVIFNYTDLHGNTMMTQAVNEGRITLVPLLAAYCPPLVDLPDRSGRTPVMYAMRKDESDSNLGMLRLILSYNPRLDVLDHGLGLGLNADSVNKIRMLQEKGYDFFTKAGKYRSDFESTLSFALDNNLNRDWDSSDYFHEPYWMRILVMLEGPNTVDAKRPYVMIGNRSEFLLDRLEQLAALLVKHQKRVKPSNLQEFIELFLNVAQKYNATAALAVLQKNNLIKRVSQSPGT